MDVDRRAARRIARGTYDTVLGFADWPYAGKRVIVLTHRPGQARHDEELVSGTPAGIVARLEGARRVYVDGGNVISQLFAARLIDDVTVSILPIVLGRGIRLFSGGEGKHRLELQGQRTWPTGLVQLRHRVRGAQV